MKDIPVQESLSRAARLSEVTYRSCGCLPFLYTHVQFRRQNLLHSWYDLEELWISFSIDSDVC